MFIVTNATPNGNYTPSVFAKREDAENWMYECTADNLRTLIDNIPNELEEDDKATCEWCMLNVEDVDIEITDNRTQIYYSDDSFNIMEIFEVKLEV